MLGARVFEAPLRRIELVSNAEIYNPVLLQAIAAVGSTQGVKGA
jgi:hypothetical protein